MSLADSTHASQQLRAFLNARGAALSKGNVTNQDTADDSIPRSMAMDEEGLNSKLQQYPSSQSIRRQSTAIPPNEAFPPSKRKAALKSRSVGVDPRLALVATSTNSSTLNEGDKLRRTLVSDQQEDVAVSRKIIPECGGVPVEASTIDGDGPLHVACRAGNAKQVALLLRTPGVKLDLKNDRGDTPLHIASYRGDMRIVKMLLHAQVALWVENDLGYFAGEVFSPDVEEETQRKIRMTLHRTLHFFHDNINREMFDRENKSRTLMKQCADQETKIAALEREVAILRLRDASPPPRPPLAHAGVRSQSNEALEDMAELEPLRLHANTSTDEECTEAARKSGIETTFDAGNEDEEGGARALSSRARLRITSRLWGGSCESKDM